MNAVEVSDYLKRLSAEVRSYHSPEGEHELVIEKYDLFAQYRGGTAACPPKFRKRDKVLTTSDIWVPGPGRHELIAEEFGMRLPEDYLGFVRNYSEYILVRNVMLWLLPADEVRECASVFRRDECGDEWGDDVPYSIFPFAEIADSEGLLFAFRRLSPNGMDVVFFDPSFSSEFEVLGPQAARFTSDASFSDWLLRMVETEGLPFAPGDEIDEEIFTLRRVPNN